jgi:hypothetical protein
VLATTKTLAIGALDIAGGLGYFGGSGLSTPMFAKAPSSLITSAAIHGNSLSSLKPTWGYRLFSNDGTFLKNGITSRAIPETRYTKAFMTDKNMGTRILFPNRAAAYQWEFQQNSILRGPLNFNMH